MQNDIDPATLATDIAVLEAWITELEHGQGSFKALTPTNKLAIRDLKNRLRQKQDILRRLHQRKPGEK